MSADKFPRFRHPEFGLRLFVADIQARYNGELKKRWILESFLPECRQKIGRKVYWWERDVEAHERRTLKPS